MPETPIVNMKKPPISQKQWRKQILIRKDTDRTGSFHVFVTYSADIIAIYKNNQYDIRRRFPRESNSSNVAVYQCEPDFYGGPSINIQQNGKKQVLYRPDEYDTLPDIMNKAYTLQAIQQEWLKKQRISWVRPLI